MIVYVQVILAGILRYLFGIERKFLSGVNTLTKDDLLHPVSENRLGARMMGRMRAKKESLLMTQERRRFRIFVVDDESVIAMTLATILQRSGFEAVSFTAPVEALEAARLEAPELLISDVMMPVLSGVDLAIGVREAAPRCRVLLFSGQASTADLLEEARRRGYDFELLTKPIHPSEFLQRVRLVAACQD
jgi:CheY-like chemotaxis protein